MFAAACRVRSCKEPRFLPRAFFHTSITLAALCPLLAQAQSGGSWTGAYGGLNLGYSSARADTASNGYTGPSSAVGGGPAGAQAMGAATPNASSHPVGMVPGAQLGYNWQHGALVYGVEFGLVGPGTRGGAATSKQVPVPGFPPNAIAASLTQADKLDYLTLWRGRVGVVNGAWLPFLSAGLAYGQSTTQVSVNQSIVGPSAGVTRNSWNSGSSQSARLGWALGAGFEYALSERWRVRAEYLYYDLGSQSTDVPSTFYLTGTNTVFASANTHAVTRWTGTVASIGLSYRF